MLRQAQHAIRVQFHPEFVEGWSEGISRIGGLLRYSISRHAWLPSKEGEDLYSSQMHSNSCAADVVS